MFKNHFGQPGEEVFSSEAYCSGHYKKRKVVLALDSLFLRFPREGLFVGLEILGCNGVWYKAKNNRKMPPCNISIAADYAPLSQEPNLTYCRYLNYDTNWSKSYCAADETEIRQPRFGLYVFE